MQPIKTVLFGYGYWGKKVKNALENLGYEVAVVDPKLKLPQPSESNFAFIVSPEETHYEVIKENLLKSRHVFVEKPLALKRNEATELIKLATRKKLTLFVDYTFLYDPHVAKIKEIIDGGTLGAVHYIESKRYSINIIKPVIKVTDDLAPHDIYLFRHLLHTQPIKIKSQFVSNNREAIVEYISLANVKWTAKYSWVRHQAKRELRVVAEHGEVLWTRQPKRDLLKVKQTSKWLIVKIPVGSLSPLELAIKDFFKKVEKNDHFLSQFNNYLEDVSVLESIRDADSFV